MNRDVLIKYGIITKEEDEKFTKEENYFSQNFINNIQEQLDEHYKLYLEVCVERYESEVNLLNEIVEILNTELMHFICMSKKYNKKIKNLLYDAKNDEYAFIFSGVFLKQLKENLVKIQNDYTAEMNKFQTDIKKSIKVDDWKKYEDLFCSAELFSKCSNLPICENKV